MSTSPARPAVACNGLTFAWTDGTVVLRDLDLAFDAGRTGIIGRNGSGKSTLLELVAGRRTPTAGTVTVDGVTAYLPQHVAQEASRSVADLLGIGPTVRALRRIITGDGAADDFRVVGDDWDVEDSARAVLARVGLPPDLNRTVGTLSGGEAVLAGVAGLLVRGAAVSLLDEPTNNLDRRARERLYDAVRTWPGVLIVVSHDRELLERIDAIVELRDGAARTFGGTFSEYRTALAVEQDAAERAVRSAEGGLRRERRQQLEAQTKLARRERSGRKAAASLGLDKATAQYLKRRSQMSAGRQRGVLAERVAEAQSTLDGAETRIRDDARIRIELPATVVPAGRTVVQFDGTVVRGPERIALRGRNGSGKTTLLWRLVGLATVPVRLLPQRLDVLDPNRSVLANVRAFAPTATPHEIRAELARFLLRGDRVDQQAGTLSGGEQFRATLACLLVAEPAPQLLLLDEPTNNLDLDSVAQLVSALRAYRGALVVSAHDEAFLAELGIDRHWTTDGPRLDG